MIYLYDVKGFYDKQTLSSPSCYSSLPCLDIGHFKAIIAALFEGTDKLFREQDLLIMMDGRKPSNLAAMSRVLNHYLKKQKPPKNPVKNIIMRLHYNNNEFAKGALRLEFKLLHAACHALAHALQLQQPFSARWPRL